MTPGGRQTTPERRENVGRTSPALVRHGSEFVPHSLLHDLK
jgi:hypothetical protein